MSRLEVLEEGIGPGPRDNFEFRAEFLNAFNTPWFTPVTGEDDNTYTIRTRSVRPPRTPAGPFN